MNAPRCKLEQESGKHDFGFTGCATERTQFLSCVDKRDILGKTTGPRGVAILRGDNQRALPQFPAAKACVMQRPQIRTATLEPWHQQNRVEATMSNPV